MNTAKHTYCNRTKHIYCKRITQQLHQTFPAFPAYIAGAKQTELIAVLHQSGNLHQLSKKPFSVDPAGTVSMDGDDHPDSIGMCCLMPISDGLNGRIHMQFPTGGQFEAPPTSLPRLHLCYS